MKILSVIFLILLSPFLLSCGGHPLASDTSHLSQTPVHLTLTQTVTHTPALITPIQTPSPTSTSVVAQGTKYYSAIVVNEYPHDANAFTQGLVIDDGILYESTGLFGQSSLRRVNLTTGNPEKIWHLPEEYFGEGLVVFDEHLIQITWKSQTGFVYNKDDFSLADTFHYPHEGWGITTNGNVLYMSDGSDLIRILQPNDFSEIGKIIVTENEIPVTQINELEYIQGLIFANIWKSSDIAVISPITGEVVAWIQLEFLLSKFDGIPQEINVLNGIAYNKQTGQMYVTGKLWPSLFEIQIVPAIIDNAQ